MALAAAGVSPFHLTTELCLIVRAKLERAFTFWGVGAVTIEIMETSKSGGKAPVYDYAKLASGDHIRESSKLAAFDNNNWGEKARNYLYAFRKFSDATLKDIVSKAQERAKIVRGSRRSETRVAIQVNLNDRRAQLQDKCELASK
jgi:hypothetical protein